MEIIIKSAFLVALTEMGDKTQILAFILASRFRKPWTILAGILVATLLNHLLAAFLGSQITGMISPTVLKSALVVVFIGFSVWVLIPDKDSSRIDQTKYGAFLTSLIIFFLAEMGDKTQLSTLALAAQYQSVIRVAIGTTLGMLISDGLAVFFGEKLTEKIPLPLIRKISAGIFFILGIGILWELLK